MKTNNLLVAASIVALGLISGSSFAQTAPAAPAPAVAPAAAPATAGKFDKNHPRRAEVNGRLNNQNARVDKKVANGKMSASEAANIHSQDNAIHQEEKSDAKANGGHITKAEKKSLNKQENHVSKEIKTH